MANRAEQYAPGHRADIDLFAHPVIRAAIDVLVMLCAGIDAAFGLAFGDEFRLELAEHVHRVLTRRG